MSKKQALWLRLRAYKFDHIVPLQLKDKVRELFGAEKASKRAFRKKIARKLNWTDQFAKSAVNEYLKFIYLGVTADFAVTPSRVIDQVWHEHILFTKAYRDFCNEVLEYPFDHNPELIPMTDQTGTFNAQYLDTLELYKREFGIEPPSFIWSKPKFDSTKVITNGYESHKKNKHDLSTSYDYYSDSTPLYSYISPNQNNADFPEFGGFEEGNFGGGGASGSYETSGQSTGDSSSSDGGGSSGCSSSCGGGCSS